MGDLANSVPDYLQEHGFSTLQINPSVVGSTLKILTSESNTYIYEVKGQKICNSLNLNRKIKEVGYAYLNENDKLVLFYVVLTDVRLFIIRRFDSDLQVVKVYDNVESFHIHDFMCLGYPQIEIEFMGPSKSIIKFPIDDVKTCVTKENLAAKDLAEKLQTVRRHVEELSAEWDKMRYLLEENTNLEDCYALPVSSLKFSSPQEECTDKVIIISKCKSILRDKLILGMEIQNSDKKVLSDLEFEIYEKSIKEYSYSFFSTSDKVLKHEDIGFFSTRTKNASVAPGENISIFGAIPTAQLNFAFRTKIPITCYVTSGKVKDYLVKETFEITFEDVLIENKELFTLEEKFISQEFGLNFHGLRNIMSMHQSSNDTLLFLWYGPPRCDSLRQHLKKYILFCLVKKLQTIQAAKTETKLKIQAKYLSRIKLEEILKNNFKFREIITGEFYFSDSPYLNEVFVYLQGLTADETFWKITLYTSDDAQVYYVANMLLEFLSEYATILYDDDE